MRLAPTLAVIGIDGSACGGNSSQPISDGTSHLGDMENGLKVGPIPIGSMGRTVDLRTTWKPIKKSTINVGTYIIYTNPIKIPHGICEMITVNSSIFFQQLGSETIFPAANLLFESLSDAVDSYWKKLPEMPSQILELHHVCEATMAPPKPTFLEVFMVKNLGF